MLDWGTRHGAEEACQPRWHGKHLESDLDVSSGHFRDMAVSMDVDRLYLRSECRDGLPASISDLYQANWAVCISMFMAFLTRR